ncbi:MAG: hypothetical protein ABWX96_02800 [Propionibacteriaceae bacterium]
MATWEDGPEYAPLERPAEFSSPAADPLEVVPPPEQLAALAPVERPAFDAPEAAVAPLASLIPVVADERNPELPFDVASSTVTSMDSAWGAAHWSAPGGPSTPAAGIPSAPPNPVAASSWPAPPAQTSAAPAVNGAAPVYGSEPPYQSESPYGAGPTPSNGSTPGTWPPPPGPTTAWPPPTAPLPPVGGPAQLPSGYPPPGTPQWFGPGPAGQLQPPTAPAKVDARAVSAAATPGLLIVLAVGGFVHPLAPIMFGVAFFLSQRVKVAQAGVRRAFFIAIGFLGLIAVVGLLGWISFTDWWNTLAWWSLVACWAMLITIAVVVYRGLKSGPPRPPTGYTSNWG